MAYRASVLSTGSGGTVTVNKPTGTVDHDRLYLFVKQGGGSGTATFTWPSGFSEIGDASQATPDGSTFKVAEKKDASSEPSSYTITSDSASDVMVAISVALSGRDNSASAVVQGSTDTNDNASVVTIGATGVTAAANDDVMWSASSDDVHQGSQWTFTSPTNYTEREDGGAFYGAWATLGTRDNVSAGATGTLSGTMTKAANSAGWGALVVSVPVKAGIAIDVAGNSGDQAAASSYSGSASWNGSNRMLAVDVSMLGPGVTVTAMTYGGANCTFIGSKSTVTSFGAVECWRICSSDSGAPAAGSNTLSVTLSGSLEFAVEWASYTGVNQTIPTEGFNSNQATNTGSATDASVSITSVADNCWIHAAVVANDTSISAGQTSRNNISGTLGSGLNEDNNAAVTPAGATTMSATGMGITTTWAIAGYAIRNIAASSGTTLAPSTGSVTYLGNTASLSLKLAASSGAVTYAGNSPALLKTLAVGVGSVSYDGYAPGLISSFILAPTSGSVTYVGQIPALSFQLLPSEGTILYTGNIPSLNGGVTLHYSRRHGRCFFS